MDIIHVTYLSFTSLYTLITFFGLFVFSFSLVYGKDIGHNGILGNPATYYMFSHTMDKTGPTELAPTIPNNIFALYEVSFPLLSASIVTSSLAGNLQQTHTHPFKIFHFHLLFPPFSFLVLHHFGLLKI